MDSPGSTDGPVEPEPGSHLVTTTAKPSLDITHLTAGQRRGTHCAYCDRPVRSDHVTDLGQCRDPIYRTHVFPRAHPECARTVS
ncbi:hypothetical protein [Streptomyces montanisoli]|uniref:Uncharacterized protein n=1 Tax=Streptomyces montanisoli TaxID=2798581 RepID=A0A940MHJ7_9ACTN|nr:hypothetical protein [Streptomyces montanisoli]MBP0459762.1 hypothetical protein [Streptomyces montanisoli]